MTHDVSQQQLHNKRLVTTTATNDPTVVQCDTTDVGLDSLTQELRHTLNASWAGVSFVHQDCQWFMSLACSDDNDDDNAMSGKISSQSNNGTIFGVKPLPCRDSICAHLIQSSSCTGTPRSEAVASSSASHVDGKHLVNLDAIKDARFRHSTLVAKAPHIRFYAEAPLLYQHNTKNMDDNHDDSDTDSKTLIFRAVCVLDPHPGTQWTDAESVILQTMASRIVQHLTRRHRLDTSVQIPTESLAETVDDVATAKNSASRSRMTPEKSLHVLEPVNFSKTMNRTNVNEASCSNCNSSGRNVNGKRSRTNSPERRPDDTHHHRNAIILKPQRNLPQILPSPDSGNIINPDEFLAQLITALCPGVSVKAKPALELGDKYFSAINEEQMARYNLQVVQMARANDLAALQKYYETHGRDALDCYNRFGEGLLNMACRRGFTTMVDFLLSPAVQLPVRVRDDYGRTPLHDACWHPDPQIDICAWILSKDPTLFLVADKRGYTPFQYARKSDWPVWRKFLVDHVDQLYSLARSDILATFS